jgi:hypothetical protein
LPWSVYTWLPGEPATAEGSSESASFAADLAEFIAAVRGIDTRGRTYGGNGRGGVLFSHDDWTQECLARSQGLLDIATLRAVWAEMRDIPRGDSPDVMNRCDLIPPTCWLPAGASSASLTSADSALPIQPSIWSAPGTYWMHCVANSSGTASAATTRNGREDGRGPFSKRWGPSGTTSTPAQP